MTSDVDICNRALSRLGTKATIASMTENSTEARTCAIWYEATRDALLRAFDWNFARRRVVLADLGAPPTGWDYRYAMPTDCLRLLRLVDGVTVHPSAAFEVAGDADGRVILADEAEAEALYTAKVEIPDLFDAGFAAALVEQLAANIAYPITQKSDVSARLAQMARMAFNEAAASAANENRNSSNEWADFTPDAISVRG